MVYGALYAEEWFAEFINASYQVVPYRNMFLYTTKPAPEQRFSRLQWISWSTLSSPTLHDRIHKDVILRFTAGSLMFRALLSIATQYFKILLSLKESKKSSLEKINFPKHEKECSCHESTDQFFNLVGGSDYRLYRCDECNNCMNGQLMKVPSHGKLWKLATEPRFGKYGNLEVPFSQQELTIFSCQELTVVKLYSECLKKIVHLIIQMKLLRTGLSGNEETLYLRMSHKNLTFVRTRRDES